MGIVDSIKGNLGNTQLPPNADKIINLVKRVDEIKSKSQNLLMEVSHISIADTLTDSSIVGNYNEANTNLQRSKDKYQTMVDSELNLIMEEFEDFYHVIENNNSSNLANETLGSTDLILSMFRDIEYDHGDILRATTQARTINEFKRFS